MPSPLELFVETKEKPKKENESLGMHEREPSANILEASANGEIQKNKQQSSPRRKQTNRPNGHRQNRNSSLIKRNTSDNNNNNNGPKQFNSYKASNVVNQHKPTMNDFQKPQPPQLAKEQGESKKLNHSNKVRSITKVGSMTNFYDERSSSAPSPTVESQKPSFNMPQQKHERDNMTRKYSMDFLHKVGYKISHVSGVNMPPAQHSPKTPKPIDDANLFALKMALGDNSGYYTHVYAGSMYGNQMVLHQQQQQLNQFTRYQQQNPQMQRLQRMSYQRGPQDNYQRVYQPSRYHEQEVAANLPCLCTPPVQPQFQRNYSNSYSHSPSYQNGTKYERRDYRDNSKKPRDYRGNGYHQNDRGYNKRDYNRNSHLGKSHSFSEEDSNKAIHFNRALSDDLAYRSLSPTPPSSSLSSSPGAKGMSTDKATMTSNGSNSELAEDSASTASASSSVASGSGKLKVSLSAPILMEPEEPSKQVNMWIDNNFGGSKALRSGYSISAENLNVVYRDPPITIIKRPPSVNEIAKQECQPTCRSTNTLMFNPQQPFEYYLARSEESEMRAPPAQLKSESQWDRLSEQMWEKFSMFQQSRSTYRKKMHLWRDLNESVKVSKHSSLSEPIVSKSLLELSDVSSESFPEVGTVPCWLNHFQFRGRHF